MQLPTDRLYLWWLRQQMLDAIEEYKHHYHRTIDMLGIQEITHPFWARMPYTNIFAAMAPDLLHQLDKGVFGEYLVKWGSVMDPSMIAIILIRSKLV
jgi:hypothetical protein